MNDICHAFTHAARGNARAGSFLTSRSIFHGTVASFRADRARRNNTAAKPRAGSTLNDICHAFTRAGRGNARTGNTLTGCSIFHNTAASFHVDRARRSNTAAKPRADSTLNDFSHVFIGTARGNSRAGSFMTGRSIFHSINASPRADRTLKDISHAFARTGNALTGCSAFFDNTQRGDARARRTRFAAIALTSCSTFHNTAASPHADRAR